MSDPHPFRTAWATRDLEAWASTFAPDIVLHSPIIQTPFEGADLIRMGPDGKIREVRVLIRPLANIAAFAAALVAA